jgi:hypothetical protein
MTWHIDRTIVAGADLSAQQYKFVGPTGVLATSETNPVGVLQGKPKSGEHGAYTRYGTSRVYMSIACSKGDFIGQSNATSGAGAIVTSGGFAFGQVYTGADSGGFAIADLFGAPIYVAK